MKALLTAALLGAFTIAASDPAPTTPPPAVPKILAPNPPAEPPANGGKDGPYQSVIRAGIDARVRRLHCLRADVLQLEGVWWVYYYPFP